MDVYWYADLTAQMPVTKPAQGHKSNKNSITQKQNTKQTKQKHHGMKSIIKEILGQKP